MKKKITFLLFKSCLTVALLQFSFLQVKATHESTNLVESPSKLRNDAANSNPLLKISIADWNKKHTIVKNKVVNTIDPNVNIDVVIVTSKLPEFYHLRLSKTSTTLSSPPATPPAEWLHTRIVHGSGYATVVITPPSQVVGDYIVSAVAFGVTYSSTGVLNYSATYTWKKNGVVVYSDYQEYTRYMPLP